MSCFRRISTYFNRLPTAVFYLTSQLSENFHIHPDPQISEIFQIFLGSHGYQVSQNSRNLAASLLTAKRLSSNFMENHCFVKGPCPGRETRVQYFGETTVPFDAPTPTTCTRACMPKSFEMSDGSDVLLACHKHTLYLHLDKIFLFFKCFLFEIFIFLW